MSDQPPQSDSIPVVLDRARETLGHVLRLVRPAQAELIEQLVGELARDLECAMELTIEQAEHRAAAVVAALLERLEKVEAERGEQAREVGNE